MKPDTDMNSLIDALKSDLPNDRDAQRVRARLAAVGISVGAGLATQVAAGSAVMAKATALSAVAELSTRVLGLSWVSKIGLATAVTVSAVGGPMLVSQARESRPAPARVVAPQTVTAQASAIPVAPSELQELPGKGQVEPATPEPKPQVIPTAKERAEKVSVAELDAVPNSVLNVAPKAPDGQSPVSATKSFPLTNDAFDAPTAPAAAPATTTTDAALLQSSLREETALLDGAFAALRTGDHATAERLISEHAQRFPNGLLFRERERALLKLREVSDVRKDR